MTPDILRCVTCQAPVTADQYIIVGSKRVPVCPDHIENLKRDVVRDLETDIEKTDFLDWQTP